MISILDCWVALILELGSEMVTVQSITFEPLYAQFDVFYIGSIIASIWFGVSEIVVD